MVGRVLLFLVMCFLIIYFIMLYRFARLITLHSFNSIINVVQIKKMSRPFQFYQFSHKNPSLSQPFIDRLVGLYMDKDDLAQTRASMTIESSVRVSVDKAIVELTSRIREAESTGLSAEVNAAQQKYDNLRAQQALDHDEESVPHDADAIRTTLEGNYGNIEGNRGSNVEGAVLANLSSTAGPGPNPSDTNIRSYAIHTANQVPNVRAPVVSPINDLSALNASYTTTPPVMRQDTANVQDTSASEIFLETFPINENHAAGNDHEPVYPGEDFDPAKPPRTPHEWYNTYTHGVNTKTAWHQRGNGAQFDDHIVGSTASIFFSMGIFPTVLLDNTRKQAYVRPYAVGYCSHRPLDASMLHIPDWQQFVGAWSDNATLNLDISLVGDSDCQKAITSAINLCQPKPGSWVWIMPMDMWSDRVGGDIVAFMTAHNELVDDINNTVRIELAWNQLSHERKMEIGTHFKISGASLGVACIAAFMYMPRVAYTGFTRRLVPDFRKGKHNNESPPYDNSNKQKAAMWQRQLLATGGMNQALNAMGPIDVNIRPPNGGDSQYWSYPIGTQRTGQRNAQYPGTRGDPEHEQPPYDQDMVRIARGNDLIETVDLLSYKCAWALATKFPLVIPYSNQMNKPLLSVLSNENRNYYYKGNRFSLALSPNAYSMVQSEAGINYNDTPTLILIATTVTQAAVLGMYAYTYWSTSDDTTDSAKLDTWEVSRIGGLQGKTTKTRGLQGDHQGVFGEYIRKYSRRAGTADKVLTEYHYTPDEQKKRLEQLSSFRPGKNFKDRKYLKEGKAKLRIQPHGDDGEWLGSDPLGNDDMGKILLPSPPPPPPPGDGPHQPPPPDDDPHDDDPQHSPPPTGGRPPSEDGNGPPGEHTSDRDESPSVNRPIKSAVANDDYDLDQRIMDQERERVARVAKGPFWTPKDMKTYLKRLRDRETELIEDVTHSKEYRTPRGPNHRAPNSSGRFNAVGGYNPGLGDHSMRFVAPIFDRRQAQLDAMKRTDRRDDYGNVDYSLPVYGPNNNPVVSRRHWNPSNRILIPGIDVDAIKRVKNLNRSKLSRDPAGLYQKLKRKWKRPERSEEFMHGPVIQNIFGLNDDEYDISRFPTGGSQGPRQRVEVEGLRGDLLSDEEERIEREREAIPFSRPFSRPDEPPVYSRVSGRLRSLPDKMYFLNQGQTQPRHPHQPISGSPTAPRKKKVPAGSPMSAGDFDEIRELKSQIKQYKRAIEGHASFHRDMARNQREMFGAQGDFDDTNNKWVSRVNDAEHPTHYPGHNFTGPGTDVIGRISAGIGPTNAVDECSMYHDLAYTIIGDKLNSHEITEETASCMVRYADENFITCVREIPKDNIPNDGSRDAALAAMRAKILSEDTGMMDPMKYIDSPRPKASSKPNACSKGGPNCPKMKARHDKERKRRRDKSVESLYREHRSVSQAGSCPPSPHAASLWDMAKSVASGTASVISGGVSMIDKVKKYTGRGTPSNSYRCKNGADKAKVDLQEAVNKKYKDIRRRK